MSADQPTLAEQRQSIRQQLQLQRQVVAQRLAPTASTGGGYPRSMTMRFLLQRPELVTRLLKLIVGAHLASSIAPLLALLHLLPSVIAFSGRKPEAIAPIKQNDAGNS